MADEEGDLTPEGEETLAVETPARPEWLPEQYRDEQAFAQAHKEAQRKISEQGNELAELRQEMHELALSTQPPQQGDPGQNPYVLAYQRAVEEGDIAAQLSLQAQLTQTVVQEALKGQAPTVEPAQDMEIMLHIADQKVQAKYGAEYEGLTAEVEQVLQQNPHLIAGSKSVGEIERGLETAFQLAHRDKLLAGQQSLAQQQAEQEKARQRKIDQESLSGSGPTRVASQSEQEKVRERIWGADTGGFRVGNQ